MKILISWIGWVDFDRDTNRVSKTSPNVDMHKKINIKFDKHILLSSAKEGDNPEHNKAILLRSHLDKEFRNKCTIQLRFLNINDPYDYNELYPKSEAILDDFKNDEIYINFSIGTTSMRIVWAFLTEAKNYNIRLIFGREPGQRKTNKQQFEQLVLKSLTPELHTIQTKTLDEKFEPKLTLSLQKIYERARKAASYDVKVLILGETGTGKEELARYIHKTSNRKEKTFVAVNCASIGDNLLESRLFGYKKGAFTGANKDQPGFFEIADGGTIFLDEIGDISSQMQQSLLRVIQEKKIIPVGDTQTKDVDVRILCATNKDLIHETNKGRFRADLFYRINEAELKLPALNQYPKAEKEEIIDYVIEKVGKAMDKKLVFGKKVRQLIYSYSYPGNIRELIALVRNIYIFNDEKVDLKEIELLFNERANTAPSVKLHDVVVHHIKNIYLLNNKNKTKTAAALGITINTLKKKLNESNEDNQSF